MFSARPGERPPLCPPPQRTPEPREGAPAGLARLSGGCGASRAAGRSGRAGTPRRRPLSCFRPCLLCRGRLGRVAPRPLPIGPRSHVLAISWGQPWPAGCAAGRSRGLGGCGRTGPGARGARPAPCPAARRVLPLRRWEGRRALATPSFYARFHTPMQIDRTTEYYEQRELEN